VYNVQTSKRDYIGMFVTNIRFLTARNHMQYVRTYTLIMFYTRGFLKYLAGHIRNKNMRTKRLKMY